MISPCAYRVRVSLDLELFSAGFARPLVVVNSKSLSNHNFININVKMASLICKLVFLYLKILLQL